MLRFARLLIVIGLFALTGLTTACGDSVTSPGESVRSVLSPFTEQSITIMNDGGSYVFEVKVTPAPGTLPEVEFSSSDLKKVVATDLDPRVSFDADGRAIVSYPVLLRGYDIGSAVVTAKLKGTSQRHTMKVIVMQAQISPPCVGGGCKG